MKKILFLLSCFVCSIVFTGCTNFSPSDYGKFAGTASYATYQTISEKHNNKEMEEEINNLWKVVNEMETINDLVASTDKLSAAFDKVIANKELSSTEKIALSEMKEMVMVKINQVMSNSLQSNQDAVEFLIGFRAGVNSAIVKFSLVK